MAIICGLITVKATLESPKAGLSDNLLTVPIGDPRSIFTCRKDSEAISVNLVEVMGAMLACVQECGGEDGKRYVASAIVACSRKGGIGDMKRALAVLGTTWLTHLLFVSKTSRKQPYENPHEVATPTVETTTYHVGRRSVPFQDDVIVRDGYRCVLTGIQDRTHPALDKNAFSVNLRACHILHRVIGKFEEDQRSESFKSAVTTFELLVNFTRLPIRTLEELHNHINGASNGMMLNHDAKMAFDDFSWCLKQTETENVYALKVFERVGILYEPQDNLVTFRDLSGTFSPGSIRTRETGIALPNPHHIAIHAAIAEILHVSGAGKFFDKLLHGYENDQDEFTVRSWPDLENEVGEAALRVSVIESLRSIKVY